MFLVFLNTLPFKISSPAAAMAQKNLRVTSPNGDQRTVPVMDTTTVKEILQQCQEGDVQDRQATLIHGVTILELDRP